MGISKGRKEIKILQHDTVIKYKINRIDKILILS